MVQFFFSEMNELLNIHSDFKAKGRRQAGE